MNSFHGFQQRFSDGEQGEHFLDAVFQGIGVKIRQASRLEQGLGIDRFFYRDGRWQSIDYKTDSRTGETGNAFIETISVDRPHEKDDAAPILGWAVTSQADLLLYYVPCLERVWEIPFARIRSMLPNWIASYPTKYAQNRTYRTWGVLVPFSEVQALAINVTDVTAGPRP